jgi:hypothetical protein
MVHIFNRLHNSPSFSAKVKNAWSCTSTLPHVTVTLHLIKHNDNFTFMIGYLETELMQRNKTSIDVNYVLRRRPKLPRGLLSLERWDRWLESRSRHGCLCAFILFVLFCVLVAALRRAQSPSNESYRLCRD